MSQPPDHFERIFDFTDFSAMQPSAQQPGQKIDQELNAARESINDTIDRLNEIQRDDGKVRSSALDTTEFTNIVNAATATATAAAASASTSATTATTQAGLASTSATNAGNSATSASGSAATATSQAATATAATVTATTKAAEAADSAANALISKNSAFSSASSATSSSAAAEGFSISASLSATIATNKATDATTQAGLASGSAVAAGNSATAANGSAIAASNSASSASASAVSAAASAATINPSTYLTTATAATTYAVIAAGQPTSGTVGQVLTKNSGTSWDSSWQTLIPGDRYLTSSTTSLAIDNANKTLTVGTGLSYTSQQDVVIAYDAANHMHAQVLTYNSGTGVMTVDVRTHTGSGTYSAWTVNVGGTVPLQSVLWGEVLGTLGNQTDLATALNNKLETSTAATTYAPLASPALTGNVTITSNSTGAALFIEQAGAGNILTLYDQASDTNFVAIDANGKVNTIVADATTAGLNVPHTTVAPTTPVNGDIWSTTGGLFARINAGTKQLMTLSDTQTVSGSITFSNASQTLGNSTAASTINVGTGATISASTKTVNVATGGVSGSTTLTTIGPVLGASTTSIGGTTAASTLNLATGATLGSLIKTLNIGTGSTLGSTYVNIGSTVNSLTTVDGNFTVSSGQIVIGNSTGTASINIATGATLTATTKAVNIGTNGVAGSTTNIAIGSTTGTSTTTLQGTTNGITAAADTNSVALATTAFVVGQAGSATPLVNGTAAVGTSLRYARQDHVHPTDTTRAPLASPSLTGTPLSTTAAADTNTTQIATTAYVVGQASSTAPVIDGTATVGTSLKYARADHVHPTDTSRAALASPTFTGTPLSTTAAVDTNTTQIATTAYVVGQGYAKLASPTFTGTPSLPTGTTAVTQTAGNNTTALATTAFVTAAVPAFAATADINSPSSTTKVTSLDSVRRMLLHPGFQLLYLGAGQSQTANGGYFDNNLGGRWKQYDISTTAGSRAQFTFDNSVSSLGLVGLVRGQSKGVKDFSKKIYMTGRIQLGTPSNTQRGDNNSYARINLGGKNAFGGGDLSSAIKGFGWNVAGVIGNAMNLQVSNGTTLTTVASSFVPVSGQIFDWELYSDGSGNVTLTINDSVVATTNLGPTGTAATGLYLEGVDAAVASVSFAMESFGTKIYFSS